MIDRMTNVTVVVESPEGRQVFPWALTVYPGDRLVGVLRKVPGVKGPCVVVRVARLYQKRLALVTPDLPPGVGLIPDGETQHWLWTGTQGVWGYGSGIYTPAENVFLNAEEVALAAGGVPDDHWRRVPWVAVLDAVAEGQRDVVIFAWRGHHRNQMRDAIRHAIDAAGPAVPSYAADVPLIELCRRAFEARRVGG